MGRGEKGVMLNTKPFTRNQSTGVRQPRWKVNASSAGLGERFPTVLVEHGVVQSANKSWPGMLYDPEQTAKTRCTWPGARERVRRKAGTQRGGLRVWFLYSCKGSPAKEERGETNYLGWKTVLARGKCQDKLVTNTFRLETERVSNGQKEKV